MDVRSLNDNINFVGNRDCMLRDLNKYYSPRFPVHRISSELVHSFLPQHRLSAAVLDSVVAHGCLFSSRFQHHITADPRRAALTEIMCHPALMNCCRRSSVIPARVLPFLRALVNSHFADASRTKSARSELAAATASLSSPALATELHNLSQPLLQRVQSHFITGIQFSMDRTIGTDHHIFSIVGHN